MSQGIEGYLYSMDLLSDTTDDISIQYIKLIKNHFDYANEDIFLLPHHQ